MLKTTLIALDFNRNSRRSSRKPDSSKANFFKTDFLILKAQITFIQLQKVFTKAPIFNYFDQECYIWIETNAFGYTISRVPSQMTSDQQLSNLMTMDQILSQFKNG